jgi:hypothetical protein
LLSCLVSYQQRHHCAFHFGAAASINLPDDRALLRRLTVANFLWVFIGIESPDGIRRQWCAHCMDTASPVASAQAPGTLLGSCHDLDWQKTRPAARSGNGFLGFSLASEAPRGGHVPVR